jgi:hypothetical protein
MDQEDLDVEGKKSLQLIKDLVEDIRSGAKGAAANTLLVPAGLKEFFPTLDLLIHRMADATGMKIEVDKSYKLTSPYTAAFSEKQSDRTSLVAAQQKDGRPTEVLRAISDLLSLTKGLESIPSVLDTQKEELGRSGHYFIALLAVGCYYEQKYNRSATEIRSLVKSIEEVRKFLIVRLNLLFPGQIGAAESIFRLIEILFKRTIKRVFSEGEDHAKERLTKALVPLAYGTI